VTLIVIPVIFGVVKGFGLPREDRFDGQPPRSPPKSIKRPQSISEPAG
jgi:hypothetical protein